MVLKPGRHHRRGGAGLVEPLSESWDWNVEMLTRYIVIVSMLAGLFAVVPGGQAEARVRRIPSVAPPVVRSEHNAGTTPSVNSSIAPTLRAPVTAGSERSQSRTHRRTKDSGV